MEKKAHRPVHKKRGGKIAAIVLIVLLAVAAGVTAFLSIYKANTISDNVYVQNLCLGGMTAAEAEEVLNKEFGKDYFGKNVIVSYDGKEYAADLLGIVSLDAEETARNALGKSNNLLERIFKRDRVDVPFDIEADEDALENMLADFARETEEKYGTFTFNKDYTSVDVDATKLGSIMDIEETAEQILKNAESNVFEKTEAALIAKTDKDYSEELFDRLVRPAKNAAIGMNEDKSTYIIPEQVGIKADENKFKELFAKEKGVFTIDVVPEMPDVTSAELDIEFYQDVLGEYTSAYNMGLVNRSKNVALAARLVNGTVIMPGQRFSYNGVVGKRTYERGFVDATVYTGEGTEEGIGGGICQVSSTIYCAQLRADLKTVSRTNHSYTIVYVPLGQDATVVYGAIDYVFENNTSYPIKVVANANGGYLTVKIMGTKTDKSKRVDIVSVTESTTPISEVQKEAPDLPAGETQVKQSGQIGARVSTYKVYYKNDIEQKREFIARSNYKPMNKIVLVGTGEAVDAETPDVTENPDEATEVPDVTDTPGVTDTPDDTDVPVAGTDKPEEGDTPAEGEDVPVSGDTTEENPDVEVPEEVTEPSTSESGL